MELIRISDSKLKIILTESDMRRYALTDENLTYENADVRRAVGEMLAEAKEQSGFEPDSDRMLIEVYPSRGGGCELYVTKILPPAPEEKEKKAPPPTREERGRAVVYVLPTLSALLAVCAHLARVGYRDESAAYGGRGESCYLILREQKHPLSYPHTSPLYHPAEEYGERYGGADKLAYIKEHAPCILEKDAVARLAALA